MSGAIDEAVTFEDEDGEANELPTEFATATMGHVLLGQGRHDAAREVFRAALAKDPGDLEAARGLRMMGEPVAEGRVAVCWRMRSTRRRSTLAGPTGASGRRWYEWPLWPPA